MVENHFFQSLPLFALHHNNNCQGWYCKRKVSQKKLRWKNPRGGRSAPPPPRPTRVNRAKQLGLEHFKKIYEGVIITSGPPPPAKYDHDHIFNYLLPLP